MKHIGLFEGIGGFSLAARWMGWETVAWCEWDEFCQTALKYHFPEAEQHGDITKSDFTKYAQKVDIITAGFPCQPFSSAGKRLGSQDDRHLWPETLRVVKQAKPRFCVFENVFGLTSILESACESDLEIQAVHLFSEGDDSEQVGERIREVKQRTLAIIINDIREAGYTLPETSTGEAIVLCVPACAVNAPHRRDRIWIVVHRDEIRQDTSQREHEIFAGEGRFNAQHDTEQICFTSYAYGFGEYRGAARSVHSGEQSAFCIEHWYGGTGQISRFAWSWTPTHSNQESRKPHIERGWKQPVSEGATIRQEHCAGSETIANPQETGSPALRIGGEAEHAVNGEHGGNGDVTNAEQFRQPRQGRPGGRLHSEEGGEWKASWSYDDGRWPTQSPICQRNDGLSNRLVGITVSKHREKSIGAFGNAIVPQVALEIFKAIQESEK